MAPNNDACAIVENSIAIANDRKGSAAALQNSTILTAAVECKAEVRADFSSMKISTAAFPESGRSKHQKNDDLTCRFRPEAVTCSQPRDA